MAFRCIGNIREAGDGRFYVTCRGADSEHHINPFYIGDDEEDRLGGANSFIQRGRGETNRKLFAEWAEKNCAAPAEVYGHGSVAFESEDDASLFWFTFRQDKAA